MCGICGIIDYRTTASADEWAGYAARATRAMCSRMFHRGPDDEGSFLQNNQAGPRVSLGHRRLKIIDLSSAGRQPISNEDETLQLILNGEIYNYRELRADLEKKGHRFKSRTDTEVILHLYEEYATECVHYLRGMFAFAIWDSVREKLFLARDRAGKKPLFYFFDGKTFCFASELNALLASGLPEKKVNPAAIDCYLSFGYIPAPFSIYPTVNKLLPAHTLSLENGNVRIAPYWKLDYSRKIDVSEGEASSEVLRILKDAVKVRLNSDVPLGAFLSGGIDSSAVVALMSQLSGSKVKTFSVGFTQTDYNELAYARTIAQRYGTEHHEFIVKPSALDILPQLVEHYGEPYADSSCIPTYYVARETKKFVTVALNGDGGDELFAGYERYRAMVLAENFQKLPPVIKKILLSSCAALPDSTNQKNKLRRLKRFLQAVELPTVQRYKRWVGIFDDSFKLKLYAKDFAGQINNSDTDGVLSPFLSCRPKISLLDSLLLADTMTYLPNDLLVKVDITCMSCSLEARSPFLDHQLMEYAASLPSGYKMKGAVRKYILKSALKDLVPARNIYRPKMGFGVPVAQWFRAELKDFLADTLFSSQAVSRGYFNESIVKNMYSEHANGRKDYSFQLWTLLMLEMWHKQFMDS